jgi:diheme cytochrome c
MTRIHKLFASLTIGSLIFVTPITASSQTMVPKGSGNLTATECSACHMAYQSGFLPIRSWKAIMADLPNHFGEDASLDEVARADIEAYLVATAADRKGRNPRWLQKIPPDVAPLRISELPWFRNEHGSRRLARAKNDPNIGSISNCVACHKGAEHGNFDDD